MNRTRPMTTATVNSHEAEARARPAPSPFFALWEQADRHVPMPFLYCWLAQAPRHALATGLHQLRHVDFIYSIGNGFVAHLVARNGDFSQAVLARESPGHQLIPINRRQGLITPEAAERAIESHPSFKRLEFWLEFHRDFGAVPTDLHEFDTAALIDRFHELPWQSLRLDRPLRAGQFEPSYRFRKSASLYEFMVGAMTGTVRIDRLRRPAPTLGQPNPS